MKNLIPALLLVLALLAPTQPTFAQHPSASPAAHPATRTISGRVTDAQGQGLPGAQVQLKGTTTSATTDATGRYTLAGVPLEESILLVSCTTGRFMPLEVPAGEGATRLNTFLQHPCSKPLARPH